MRYKLFAARTIIIIVAMTCLTLFNSVTRAHEDYRSLSQLDWNDADGSVELVMQIHRHELETKLSLLLDQRLSFLTSGDFNKLEATTNSYLANNIAVRVDDNPVDMIFLGLEAEDETVIAYLEADWPDQPRSLGLMNSIFLNDLPGQINTVLATVKSVRMSGDITAGSGPLRFNF